MDFAMPTAGRFYRRLAWRSNPISFLLAFHQLLTESTSNGHNNPVSSTTQSGHMLSD
jgi:hypothetical protein